MNFTLSIECDNDVFTDDPRLEIVAILRRAATRIANGISPDGAVKILDTSGNTCGTYELIEELQVQIPDDQSWDQDELENWVNNDECLYKDVLASDDEDETRELVTQYHGMFVESFPNVDTPDLRVIDWEALHQFFEDDR